MKKIILISMVVLTGCYTTTDYLEELNTAPTINFMEEDGTLLTDSIKVRYKLKSKAKFYEMGFKIFDPNRNINEIRYSQLTGAGKLYQGDEVINNIISLSDSNNLEFSYYPEVYGLHSWKITVTDNFGLSNNATIRLFAFENLLPVAKVNLSLEGKVDKYHYKIDASESYDRDEKYGGGIYEYEFRYLGKIVRTFQEEVDIIFPGPGVYTVGVRVRDGDDEFSSLAEVRDFVVQ